MAESMFSEEVQRLIAGYVLYDLSHEEADVLEKLSAANPAIAQEIDRMQKSLEFAYAPDEVQPQPTLRNAVLKAHQASWQPTSTVPSAALPQPIPLPAHQISANRRWLTGLGTLAASLIVGLGISNYVLWRSLQALRAETQVAAEPITVTLQPTETDSPASASVVLDAANLAATLNVENLPPLAEGQVFALWTVLQPNAPFTVDAKGAILTEVFTVDEQGRQSEQIVLPPVYRDRQWIKAIAITIETATAPQEHVAQPILIETL